MQKPVNLKGKMIVVTGGAGFLGSHLCERLLELGAYVICFDNLSQGTLKNIEHLKNHKNFSFIQGNVNHEEETKSIFKNYAVDFIFHYAAVVGVKRTVENPLAVLEDIQGIKLLFSLAQENDIKKVVFASSSEVYGEPIKLPEKEDSVLNAKTPYAQVKLIGESYCTSYWEKYKLPSTALRFFNVFGPRQESSDYGFVTGIFIKQVLDGKSPTVIGDGMMTRNFVYVKDNIEAAVQTLFHEESHGEIINVGTGEAITILDLAKRIIKLSGAKLEPEFIPSRKGGEIHHRNPDIQKMKTLLHYSSRYSLDESLATTFAWYKENN